MRAGDDRIALDDLVVHARILAVDHDAVLEMVDRLTPYVAETLTTHALRHGRPGVLELTLPRETSDEAIERIRRRFGSLGRHGIVLDVRGGPGRKWTHGAEAA